jgi:cytochrome c-type biogenesis protein CcmH
MRVVLIIFIAFALQISASQIAALQISTSAFAKSPTEDPHELFKQIWSPYCKGVSLLECPSSQAQQLREEIITRMNNGESSAELLKELNTEFGDRLRMAPKTEGREGLAYWVPWILVGLGILSIFAFRRKRTSISAMSGSSSATPSSADSELQNKILKDLEERS